MQQNMPKLPQIQREVRLFLIVRTHSVTKITSPERALKRNVREVETEETSQCSTTASENQVNTIKLLLYA